MHGSRAVPGSLWAAENWPCLEHVAGGRLLQVVLATSRCGGSRYRYGRVQCTMCTITTLHAYTPPQHVSAVLRMSMYYTWIITWIWAEPESDAVLQSVFCTIRRRHLQPLLLITDGVEHLLLFVLVSQA